MTFYGFCAKHLITFDIVRPFRIWLGKTADSILPESEWLKLWGEFDSQ